MKNIFFISVFYLVLSLLAGPKFRVDYYNPPEYQGGVALLPGGYAIMDNTNFFEGCRWDGLRRYLYSDGRVKTFYRELEVMVSVTSWRIVGGSSAEVSIVFENCGNKTVYFAIGEKDVNDFTSDREGWKRGYYRSCKSGSSYLYRLEGSDRIKVGRGQKIKVVVPNLLAQNHVLRVWGSFNDSENFIVRAELDLREVVGDWREKEFSKLIKIAQVENSSWPEDISTEKEPAKTGELSGGEKFPTESYFFLKLSDAVGGEFEISPNCILDCRSLVERGVSDKTLDSLSAKYELIFLTVGGGMSLDDIVQYLSGDDLAPGDKKTLTQISQPGWVVGMAYQHNIEQGSFLLVGRK
jgi:hypothetical protein